MCADLPIDDARALLPGALLTAAEHELRAMLTSIQAGVETLALHGPSGPLSEVATTVSEASRRLSATLGQLVAAAGRLREGGPSEDLVDLQELVDDLLISRGASRSQVDGDQPVHVAGNQLLLRLLLGDLVGNAVESSRADRVQVRIRHLPRRVAEVVISNPTSPTVVPTPNADVLRFESAPGATIASILATVGDIDHRADVVHGMHSVILRIPNLVLHPSLTPGPGDRPADAPSDVIDMTARRR